MWINGLSGGGAFIPPITASLLMHFDGADTSTTMTDEYGKAATANGNAQIDTAASKFGGASLLLDGSGDWVQLAAFADACAESEDWLLECWVNPDVNNTLKCIVGMAENSAGATKFILYTNNSGKVTCLAYTAAEVLIVNFSGATTITTGAWHHVGVLKVGTKWGILLDGAVDGTATETGTQGGIATTTIKIGRWHSGVPTRDFDGWIDEMRIVKGTQVAGIYYNALTSLTYTVPTVRFEKG